MSLIHVGLHGEAIVALVVGGGRVGTRRAVALLASRAKVRVIAPAVSAELLAVQLGDTDLAIDRREYAGRSDLGDATLVVAATDSPEVNERVARDAVAARIPVNVADAPGKGTVDFLAIHRAGAITIGVSAGGVPGAAVRIRDAIADRIDLRYADAVETCVELRDRTLGPADTGVWREVASDLIDESFCDSIENGTFEQKAAKWR